MKPLLRLLHSTYLPLILSAAACVRNVSIHPSNESPIIDSGFLTPLIELLSFDENEEVQCHAISTLRNLAASSERNKGAIVEAHAVERIKDLVLSVPLAVQSEMTACVAVLALSGMSTTRDRADDRRLEATAIGDGYLRGLDSLDQLAKRRSPGQQCCCSRKLVLKGYVQDHHVRVRANEQRLKIMHHSMMFGTSPMEDYMPTSSDSLVLPTSLSSILPFGYVSPCLTRLTHRQLSNS